LDDTHSPLVRGGASIPSGDRWSTRCRSLPRADAVFSATELRLGGVRGGRRRRKRALAFPGWCDRPTTEARQRVACRPPPPRPSGPRGGARTMRAGHPARLVFFGRQAGYGTPACVSVPTLSASPRRAFRGRRDGDQCDRRSLGAAGEAGIPGAFDPPKRGEVLDGALETPPFGGGATVVPNPRRRSPFTDASREPGLRPGAWQVRSDPQGVAESGDSREDPRQLAETGEDAVLRSRGVDGRAGERACR
jgi:hypothetical protein